MDPLEEAPWADTPQSSATTSQQEEAQASSASNKSAAAPSSAARPSRSTPRRLVAQPTRLQAVEDDPLGPLGPLGGAPGVGADGPPAADSPPAPPLKEQLPVRTTLAPNQAAVARRAPADPHRIDDDDGGGGGGYDGTARGPRVPPPVPPAQISPVRSSSRPSVSVEQAAKPGFAITVGDPHTVADMPGRSHTEYMVHTKVGLPESPGDRRTALLTERPVGVDDVQSVQTTRVRRHAAVPRLPVAVQHAAYQ